MRERNIMSYSEYISQCFERGTIGSSISLGIFAMIGVFAALGLYFGLMRGFSKSVIRFLTILLSAFGALYGVMATCNIIINLTNKSGAESVDQVIDSYAPGVLDSLPGAAKSVLAEMNPETATIFVMMLVCIFIAPILFIAFFYLLKTLSFLLYKLLAGLVGAIDYCKGIPSVIFGAIVGLIQGVVIAGIVLMPISGLCGVLEIAKEPLLENEDEDSKIAQFYDDVFNDLVENPVFDTIDSFGGASAYEQMVNVTIGGRKINMAEESKGVIKLFSDALPLVTEKFEWASPTDPQEQAFVNMVEDIGDNELIASLVSDIMRGVAVCVDNESVKLPFEGTNKDLIEDVLGIFHTSTKDNVEEDLDMIVDIYLLLSNKGLITAFNDNNSDVMRELLTDTDESGDTIIDLILARLNESERGKPIVRSFTKISLSLMQSASGIDGDAAKLYEDVQDDLHTVLSHNKEDFATDEEYREAVKSDLDKALEENNLQINDDVKENMVDYIEENFSNKSEITQDDIDDAILSYYNSYAATKDNPPLE